MNYEKLNNQFSEFKVLNLADNYPNLIGNVQWGVVTELSAEELAKKYSDILPDSKNYIILSPCMGDFILRCRSEDNHAAYVAKAYYDYMGFVENVTEAIHPETRVFTVDDHFRQQEYDNLIDQLNAAIDELSPIEKQRVIDHYYNGKRIGEIAREEGISHQAVSKSMALSLRKIKKILKKMGCEGY